MHTQPVVLWTMFFLGVLVVLMNYREKRTYKTIPVIIVCYNNGFYVRSMVQQLVELGVSDIVVIDNKSDDKSTINLLRSLDQSVAQVLWMDKNYGHLVFYRPEIWNRFPDVFAVTDPDLKLGENMPRDFLYQLADLTYDLGVFKAGVALDIQTNAHDFYGPHPLMPEPTPERECKNWTTRIPHERLIVYDADVDTTMAVYNKMFFKGRHFGGGSVRVAGSFTALHLPWYKSHNESLPREVLVAMYGRTATFSSYSKFLQDVHDFA